MFEIHNPSGKKNTSAYGGQVLNFDENGIARVDQVRPALEQWLRAAGYRVVDTDAHPEQKAVFEPAEHDVKTVLAHLADADETERARVLDAEKAGQSRVSIIGKPDADGKTDGGKSAGEGDPDGS